MYKLDLLLLAGNNFPQASLNIKLIFGSVFAKIALCAEFERRVRCPVEGIPARSAAAAGLV
jgi:hypothetical protein